MTFEETLPLRIKFESQTFPNEAEELYNTIIAAPSGHVLEVGSACGGTTIVLIQAALLTNREVYSIDPYPEELEGVAEHYTIGLTKHYKESFVKNILSGEYPNITQYNETTEQCIHKVPATLAVAFIDGLHEFSSLKKEIELVLPKIVKGGFLCIHDSAWGVGQLSGTSSGGLNNVFKFIKEIPELISISVVGSLLKCQKV